MANTNEHRRVEGGGWGTDIPHLEAQWVLDWAVHTPFPEVIPPPQGHTASTSVTSPLRASVSPCPSHGLRTPTVWLRCKV